MQVKKSLLDRITQAPGRAFDATVAGIRAAGKSLYAMTETAVANARGAYDNFHITIAEGNYHIRPKSLWTLLTGHGRETDSTAATTVVGGAMLDTGRSFGKRMMWASAIALISMQAMVWVAGGLAIAGAAMFYLEYSQSRRARNEVITEVNFAGQTVQGTRADLYHLHHAQEKVMNLSTVFKQASMESTNDTIHRIIEGVTERWKRVKVLHSGRYDAGTEHYEFSEPSIKLVKDRPATRLYAHFGEDGEKMRLSAKPAFDAAAQTEEVVKRMLALEEALPADVLAKIQQARAAKREVQLVAQPASKAA